MRAAREESRKRRELLNEELRTKYNNWRCPVCQKHALSQVACRKAGGSICQSHCRECGYHSQDFGHCLYRPAKKPWKAWATAGTQKELLILLTQRTKRTCIVDCMDDDGTYRVIDEETGEIAKGNIRFKEGMWQYGTFEQ